MMLGHTLRTVPNTQAESEEGSTISNVAELTEDGLDRVIVIGAGPAGLTGALELQRCSAFCPIVYEAGDRVGGIARTED